MKELNEIIQVDSLVSTFLKLKTLNPKLFFSQIFCHKILTWPVRRLFVLSWSHLLWILTCFALWILMCLITGIAVPNSDRGDTNIQKSTNFLLPKHRYHSWNSRHDYLCAYWLSLCGNSTGIPNSTYPKFSPPPAFPISECPLHPPSCPSQ